MSIAMNTQCLLCHMQRHLKAAEALGTPDQAMTFARGLMKLYAEAPAGVGTPWLSDRVSSLYQQVFGLEPDRYREEKKRSNRFALERLDQIRGRAEQAEDPVYAALQLAILGNYIDYGALGDQVSFAQLDQLLDQAEEQVLDRDCYRQFCRDLEQGKLLVYLTDNAGEIVFDRVLGEQIHRRYPELEIVYCVRGGPAVNDATREDAAAAGIPFRVIDNGTCIAGTQLDRLGPEAEETIRRADVILSKGQGNCETLYGCSLNVYYAFLVKCARFESLFSRPKFTALFTR